MIETERFALDGRSSRKASKEEMMVEAIERMELLGISDDIILKFLDEDIVCESLPPDGRCRSIGPEGKDSIREFEEHTGVIVYLAIRSCTEETGDDLELETYLFVETDPAEWPQERAMIRKEMRCTASSHIMGHPDRSEMGEVLLAKSIGPGLVRLC